MKRKIMLRRKKKMKVKAVLKYDMPTEFVDCWHVSEKEVSLGYIITK